MLQAEIRPEPPAPRRMRKSLSDEQIAEIQAFEAPYLIEKLLKERIFETEEEAQLHFRETKRFIIMNYRDSSRLWGMHSRLVDETWHQFVLFTHEYTKFSFRFFEGYVHHAPSNAPKLDDASMNLPTPSVDEFNAYYENLFGHPPPDIWKDERVVTLASRVLTPTSDLTVRVNGDRVELVRIAPRSGEESTEAPREWVIARIDAWAEEALRFIARTGAFYVRELPGGLDDDERVELCARLVHARTLRIAP